MVANYIVDLIGALQPVFGEFVDGQRRPGSCAKVARSLAGHAPFGLVSETQHSTIIDANRAYFVNEIPAVAGTNKARE